MLLNQHTMLFEPDADLDTTRVGILDPNCKVSSIVEHAFNQAAFLCEEYYLMAPELDMTTHNVVDPGKPIELVYPPNHLHHILFELFKNSMRAVVESREKGLDLPDIEVLIVKGEHDVSKPNITSHLTMHYSRKNLLNTEKSYNNELLKSSLFFI